MLSLWATKTLPINVLVEESTKFSIEGIVSTITSPSKLVQHFGAQIDNLFTTRKKRYGDIYNESL